MEVHGDSHYCQKPADAGSEEAITLLETVNLRIGIVNEDENRRRSNVHQETNNHQPSQKKQFPDSFHLQCITYLPGVRAARIASASLSTAAGSKCCWSAFWVSANMASIFF